jgi:hypothetical protein
MYLNKLINDISHKVYTRSRKTIYKYKYRAPGQRSALVSIPTQPLAGIQLNWKYIYCISTSNKISVWSLKKDAVYNIHRLAWSPMLVGGPHGNCAACPCAKAALCQLCFFSSRLDKLSLVWKQHDDYFSRTSDIPFVHFFKYVLSTILPLLLGCHN